MQIELTLDECGDFYTHDGMPFMCEDGAREFFEIPDSVTRIWVVMSTDSQIGYEVAMGGEKLLVHQSDGWLNRVRVYYRLQMFVRSACRLDLTCLELYYEEPEAIEE
ncbi:hypothetical protein LOC67_23580 [Stieleria sp. JC731]|uniref:hypothetical protein n=1 Tax=Pirellulaceae TaxID=2691357 RepID=UPI001E37F72F|nr:hypothetical protein [Stieleria sp. JC731]MCC9603542.1 hypothetical protein [Stieleria sp. JC731]